MIAETNIIPDWIDSQAQPINGLDLLGLRLPVQNISESLLTGITTISPRIRYLSIRAWVIKSFGLSGLKDDHSSLMDFVYRMECAIVCGVLLANESTVNIPGSDEALEILEQSKETIQLKRLVIQTAFTIYTGPTYNLLIGIPRESDVPALTEERGVPLAEALENLLRNTQFLKLLRDNPQLSETHRDVLKELGETLKIDDIPDSERDLLVEAIIPEKPIGKGKINESMRIGVYTLLLELAKKLNRSPIENDVFEYALALNHELTPILQPVLDGYLIYRIRDVIALAHEYALEEVARELAAQNEVIQADQLISSLLTDEINLPLKELGLLINDETYKSMEFNEFVDRIEKLLLNKKVEHGLYRWDGNLNENWIIEYIQKRHNSSLGLLPVVWILCRKRISSANLRSKPLFSLMSRQGYARIGLEQVVFPEIQRWEKNNPTIEEIIARIVRRSVDQHLRIAWARMFADVKKDVAVLSADGDYWLHRRSFKAARTASRIKEAIGWLKQLKLIDDQGITDEGNKVFSKGLSIIHSLEKWEDD